jgi:hypothetical protein
MLFRIDRPEPSVWMQDETLALYMARAGLSEREVARRAYPDLSEGAAQQRLRRRREAPSTRLPESEARAIAEAVGRDTYSLGALVVHVLVDPKTRELLAPGELIYLHDHAEEAAAAAVLAEQSGLFPRPDVVAATDLEVSHKASFVGHPPIFNFGSGVDSSLDDFLVLLDIERRLRGGSLGDAERIVIGNPAWCGPLLRAARDLKSRHWRARGKAKAVLRQRLDALCDLLVETVEYLRDS